MQIDLNISPCPNDTFIFAPLILGLIKDCPFTVKASFHDVQTLNQMVLGGTQGLTKISFGVLNQIPKSFKLLQSGGAMGYGCGPLLLSHSPKLTGADIYLPGENTTASFLFKFWAKKNNWNGQIKYGYFDKLYEDLLAAKSIQQAVLIHECRFLYQKDKLNLIVDLGAFWEEETQSPIPLGAIVSKVSVKINWEYWIQKSIQYSQNHRDIVMPFIKQHAQFPDEEVIQKHIDTYVNDFSLDFGDEGKKAIANFLSLQKG